MIIETERLILRPWEESDAESLYEYAKDPAVGPIAGWPIHTSVENSLDIIRNVLSVENTFAVCLKADNKAIGSLGLMSPAQTQTKISDTEIEIGYWIGAPFWGKAYVPEAVRALQKYAFGKLGCTAMWCGYYDGNEKSRRCQEKCGFTYHHTEKDKPCALMGDVRTEHFTYLTRETWLAMQKKAVIYIHGKGGNAGEAEYYKKHFPEYEVIGFDYISGTPWEAAKEFAEFFDAIGRRYASIMLIANSIGAYFAMQADGKAHIEKAYFISPIVDMEKLIMDMMRLAGVTEAELKESGEIETAFGETLSWDYLSWVRNHQVHWDIPTSILYGSLDNMQSKETIKSFADGKGADLTVMENGEHWFHTEEQMEFLDNWIGR